MLEEGPTPTSLYDLVPEGVSVSAVMVCLWWFIKYIRNRDLDQQSESERNVTRFSEVSAKCHDFQHQQQARYTEALGHTTKLFKTSVDAVLAEHRYTGERIVSKLEEVKAALTERKPPP